MIGTAAGRIDLCLVCGLVAELQHHLYVLVGDVLRWIAGNWVLDLNRSAAILWTAEGAITLSYLEGE
jgi:hypothetical protein